MQSVADSRYAQTTFDLKVAFGSILSQLEFDASAQIRDQHIVHARVRWSLCRSTWEAKVIPEDNIADNHLHGVVGEEPARADNLAVAEVQVVLARGGELYCSMLACSKKLDRSKFSYDASCFRRDASCYCTVAAHRISRGRQLARDLCRLHMLPSGCGRHRVGQCRREV